MPIQPSRGAKRSPIERWFPHRRPSARARVRLVAFAWAGGGASVFRAWASELPQEIELLSVELPGRETRFGEPFAGAAQEIVEPLVSLILELRDRPLALFGHSLGAFLAFETARALRDRDFAPSRLLVSGARGPSVPRRNPTAHDLPDGELVKELGELAGTQPAVLADRELVELLLPLLRADLKLAELHRPSPAPPLPCPIAAFGGIGDRDVTPQDLDAWRRETTLRFSRHMLPGNHFYLNTARSDLLRMVAQHVLEPVELVEKLDGTTDSSG